ncbi:MAG: hypothetical protein Q4A01_07115 [Coriobacteriales bacterium]|nr:hypothetical protein [Coriobacteriales bacterium]
MTEREARLVAQLERRRLVANGVSKWGQPALRHVPEGHEPQRRMDATALQRRFVACAHGTPSPGTDLCASWVEQSFSRLGLGVVLGDAAYLYNSYCPHTDLAQLKVGMIVATGRHPYTTAGLRHGHVGIYIGDDQVMDCAGDEVRVVDLELWLSAYGLMDEPRWGWLGSIGLS